MLITLKTTGVVTSAADKLLKSKSDTDKLTCTLQYSFYPEKF